MKMDQWQCKKCNTSNQAEDPKCASCQAPRPGFFQSTAFYIAAGGGAIIVLLGVAVSYMLGMPARDYAKEYKAAMVDCQLSPEEQGRLDKIQRRWKASDDKVSKWKAQVALNCPGSGPSLQKPPVPPTGPTSVPPKGPTAPVGQPPVEATISLKQGMQYAHQNDFENAINEFTNAIRRFPDYAAAYSNRGAALMGQKKFNLAMDDLRKAVELDPKDPNIRYNMAACYSAQDVPELDRAIASLDDALANGFSDYEALRKDPDLAKLRKHPDWRKTLEKHKVFLGDVK